MTAPINIPYPLIESLSCARKKIRLLFRLPMTPIPDFSDAELAVVREPAARHDNPMLRPCVTTSLQVRTDHERRSAMTGDGHTH